MESLKISVEQAAKDKDLADYQSIISTYDDLRYSYAAGDVFLSQTVPFLKDPKNNKSVNWLHGPILNCNPSDNKIVICPYSSSKQLTGADKTKHDNACLTTAFELLTTVKGSYDSPKIFYTVAITFQDIGMLVEPCKLNFILTIFNSFIGMIKQSNSSLNLPEEYLLIST